jgi:hypothetical protein
MTAQDDSRRYKLAHPDRVAETNRRYRATEASRERNRKWGATEAGRAYYQERDLQERIKNRERRAARQRFRYAVATGKLSRQPCHCGRTDTEGHHARGYVGSAALDVDWLCHLHHAEAHRKGQQ